MKSSKPRVTRGGAGPRELRIIGGRWRGRKLRFPDVASIRPTPDRVRETLFNWLAPVMPGARCLDLFAGSGALGLEALSRGAAAVEFVDRDPAVGRYLRETLERLGSTDGRVRVQGAEAFLAAASTPFDIVFLDPPFAAGLLPGLCAELDQRELLTPRACVYIESEATAGAPVLPAGWALHRTGVAGKVGYHLARAAPGAPSVRSTGGSA